MRGHTHAHTGRAGPRDSRAGKHQKECHEGAPPSPCLALVPSFITFVRAVRQHRTPVVRQFRNNLDLQWVFATSLGRFAESLQYFEANASADVKSKVNTI